MRQRRLLAAYLTMATMADQIRAPLSPPPVRPLAANSPVALNGSAVRPNGLCGDQPLDVGDHFLVQRSDDTWRKSVSFCPAAAD